MMLELGDRIAKNQTAANRFAVRRRKAANPAPAIMSRASAQGIVWWTLRDDIRPVVEHERVRPEARKM